ncbi:MAG: methyl-accepting chemotaxis protein [Treponema sp.]|jgi:methyl-accepting chemotaxis protein|nr:methyl-accepting chemotaxis protein [Treponema sp.]
MKIGVRLVWMISVLIIIAITLSASVTLSISQREISKLAEEQAESLAKKGVEEIKNWFDSYVDTARTIAQVMEGYKDIPAEERRTYFNFMLKQVLLAHPEINSVYANWAPSVLDNMDAEYANTPGTDETGRYIPAFVNSPNGPILLAITGFPFEAVVQVTGGNEFVFEPSLSTQEGQQGYGNTLIVNLCVPIKDNGRLVGITGLVFKLSTIQAIADTIKPLGDGYTMVFSGGGLIAAHPDSSRLGKNIKETENDTFGASLDTITDAVANGRTAAVVVPSPQGAMEYYSLPFTIGGNPKPWTLVVGVSRNTVMAPVYRILTISIVIGVLSIVFMSVSGFFIARSISRPITQTMETLKFVAEGDLTKQMDNTSKDELGDLARYLNWTVERIKALIFAIKNEAAMLSQTGMEMASHTIETAAAVNEITANIRSIKDLVSSQSDSVAGTSAVINGIITHITALEQLVENQMIRTVSMSSSSIEEMVANIQSVTQTLIKNVDNVTALAESSEVGRSGLQEVAANIQDIAHESEGLLEINAVMENIASQTNLLSMNAAIEAAHAGEAGKGFAVVAGEIRKLAESSAAQSKTIGTVLKKIKDSIGKITKSTEGVLLKFEVIGEELGTVTKQEKGVRDAMEEQGAGSASILEAIGDLNEITRQVKARSGEMEEGSRQAIREEKGLKQMTEEIWGGVSEIATGAEQINGSMGRVAEISADNRQRIAALMNEVGKFKVE